eukprot:Platyproteum_vivax@DN7285_c0_g1_i1.p1
MINDLSYSYTKARKDFNRPCEFRDYPPEVISIEADAAVSSRFVLDNPCHFVGTNIPQKSAHEVNTHRIQLVNRGQLHLEGGWPKEVDAQEHQETSKWRRRVDKDPAFQTAVQHLCKSTAAILQQNNTVDVYEEYFEGESGQMSEPMSTKTLSVLRDQVGDHCQRTVTKIAWQPENPNRFVAAYSILKFQKVPDMMPSMAFVWDNTNPNVPLTELSSGCGSPLTCVAFNLRSPEVIAGGCYNGLIQVWDLRKKGTQPVNKSEIQTSHYDPVYDFSWLQQSKSAALDCVSVSTDSHVLWWDSRNLTEPVERCTLLDYNPAGAGLGGTSRAVAPGARAANTGPALGGVSLEWSHEAGPSKFLIGTEQGMVVALNKKPKRPVDISGWFGYTEGRHFGPVYSVKRNPADPKFFLSVGDWSAKIWNEDITSHPVQGRSPLWTSKYHKAQLTSGVWSPTRPGLFMVTKQDGWMDFWDIYSGQTDIIHSHKVSDSPLWTAAVQPTHASVVAVGDTDGSITLVQMCKSLYETDSNEKESVKEMFERLSWREKCLHDARVKGTPNSLNHTMGAKNTMNDSKLGPVDEAKDFDPSKFQEFESQFLTRLES